MAFFARHVYGGFMATLGAIGLVAVGLWQTGRIEPYLTVETLPLAVILVLVGLLSACFPDIDIGSKSQRLFYWIMLFIDVWLIYQQNYKAAALLGLGAILPLLGKHRGWTHTWLAAFLVPAVFFLVPMLLAGEVRPFLVICYIVSVVAYMSHLVLDGYIRRTAKSIYRNIRP
jgi:membrane-bound metal-dependent hydrolase YbcI (DUF457 family)